MDFRVRGRSKMALGGGSRDPRRAHLAACDGLCDGLDDGPVPFAQFFLEFCENFGALGAAACGLCIGKNGTS